MHQDVVDYAVVNSLVIILIINYVRITLFKYKYDPPIAGYFNCPMTFQPSFKFVQVVARFINIVDSLRGLQESKLIGNFSGMLCLYARGVAFGEKSL